MNRGEIWLVRFDPTVGSEIGKTRPAVVVNSRAADKLATRIVVPITGWQPKYDRSTWAVLLDANPAQGLSKKSAADATQVRALSTRRFIRKMGALPEEKLNAIVRALAITIGYAPNMQE